MTGQDKIQAGPYTLDYQKKTIVMGILNITPDSFSDGGRFYAVDKAVERAEEMVAHGADIIDIGGESTRPGGNPVSLQEELDRVIPVIEAVSAAVKVPISIDTYKAETARRAIKAGAHIINDVWGAKADKEMASVAAEFDVPIILMHNRDNRDYRHFFRDVVNDLYESIMLAKKAGVKDERIILDPGVGFAKDFSLNLEMMRNLDKLVGLGYPVLLGTSRKSMIGQVLDLPVTERMEGTAATVCYGIQMGCQMIRIHDVKEMSRVARMMDALIGKGEHNG
ncbi:dihydropteroate synthase [Bacillus sp. V3-13]|uniref:dihydropteroate synthase n=1 Tax=Bacillus sp. V3-13 TaxID=2053728 RepID=UPI000C75BF55|nr:dihydropteroate synthase [Bacillus sp. V3-13]PLR78914.1 dihydropteroate synthase [Bacillus sp. V3-13]